MAQIDTALTFLVDDESNFVFDKLNRRGNVINIGKYYMFQPIELTNKNISVFSFQANIYALILCKLFNVRIIVRSNSSPLGWTKNRIKTFIFKIFFKLADKIIVNSLEFKHQFDKKFNVNSLLIYNPLNKEKNRLLNVSSRLCL